MNKKIVVIGGCYHTKIEQKKLKNTVDMAAHNTFKKFLMGLPKACEVVVLNDIRLIPFPKCDILYNEYATVIEDNIKYYDIPYLNVSILKFISKAISFFIFSIRILKKLDFDNISVFIYGMHTPYLITIPFLKKIGAKITIIIPDLPMYMDMELYKKKIKRCLKKMDFIFQKSLLKRANYYILFSKYMREKIDIPDSRTLIIEGLVSEKETSTEFQDRYQKHKKVVLYTGAINKKYGLPIIIKTFQEMNNGDVELWLFGAGDYVDEIIEIEQDYPNIKYFGSVSNQEIRYVQKIADLLINPRSSQELYTRYSFPSKILEYLVSGTPILCEKLLGIPDEYDLFLNYVADSSWKSWKESIFNLLYVDIEKAKEKARRGKLYVLNEKNNIKQVNKILEFIDDYN